MISPASCRMFTLNMLSLENRGNRSSVQSQCTSALQEKWFQQFLKKKHLSANPQPHAELTMQLQKEHNYFRIEVATVNALKGFHQIEVQRSMKIQTHTHIQPSYN